MKKSIYFAAALIALASCTSDEFTGDKALGEANGKAPISFGFETPAATRAGGADAALALGNQFIVYGEKSETTDGAAPAAGKLVFQNYQVNYAASTAMTTTSNTKDWEYVGAQHSAEYVSNITTSTADVQTIKYWDYSATNYVFTAFSAAQADLTSGAVKVTKITEKTDGNKVYDKGYTVTLTAAADPTKLYFSDRKEIAQGTGTERTAVNAYGGNVTLTFRNGISQVRVAMYETLPGYSVKVDKFYYVNSDAPTFATMTTEGTDKFYANVPNLTTDKAATLTVTYYNEGTRQNQPKISVSGTANNYLALGDGNLIGKTLAENIAAPTYAFAAGETYTSVFPQESNDKTLKLKMDYTLTAPVTGEIIKVTGATAEVPAQYLQWKPNFKYTYIFKVSNNTNGSTGGNIAGLYPITFDAVEIVAEDGTAEYITTVSEPSISTFGVKESKYVSGKADYETGTDIYAAFMEGSALQTPVLSGASQNVKIFKLTCADESYITEAAVAEALGESPTGTAKLTCTDVTADASTNFTAAPAAVTTVPGEDGVDITGTQAVKLTGVKVAGYYAIEYKASAAWTGTYDKVYKVVKVVAP